MKKTTTLFLIAFFLFIGVSYGTSVKAVSPEWVRIEKDDVFFYKNSSATDENRLFVLPKSYYLAVVGNSSQFYQVEVLDHLNNFSKIVGYVLKEQVVPTSDTPLLPTYPRMTLNVSQTSALREEAQEEAMALVTLLKGQTCKFYGYLGNWVYVKFADQFGYLSLGALETFSVAAHPTPLPVEIPPDPNEGTDPVNPYGNWEIILVLLVAIPACVIVILLFFPQKPKKQPVITIEKKTPKYLDESTLDDFDFL